MATSNRMPPLKRPKLQLQHRKQPFERREPTLQATWTQQYRFNCVVTTKPKFYHKATRSLTNKTWSEFVKAREHSSPTLYLTDRMLRCLRSPLLYELWRKGVSLTKSIYMCNRKFNIQIPCCNKLNCLNLIHLFQIHLRIESTIYHAPIQTPNKPGCCFEHPPCQQPPCPALQQGIFGILFNMSASYTFECFQRL